MTLSTAWTFARKDLKLFFRDRTGLMLTLALPLFLATIFGAAMGGMGGDDGIGKVKLLVEDLDQSAASRALVAELAKSKGLEIKAGTDVRKTVAKGKVAAALLIPSGYAADIDDGRTPQIKLFRDPAKTIEQQVIAGNLMPAFFKATGERIGRGMMRRSLALFGFPEAAGAEAQQILDQAFDSMQALASSTSRAPDDSADAAGGATSQDSSSSFDFANGVSELLGLDVENVAGSKDASDKEAGQAHAVSGIAVMMLLFGLAGAGGTILEEQVSGTLQRIQLCPTASSSILVGKFMFMVIAGLMQLVVLFLYGSLLFNVAIWREPLALAVLSLGVVCAATGLGVLLAVVCRTRKQLEGMSTLVILVMSALGGSWFPLVITPAWYQRLGHFTLNAWAMDGFQGIFWYGKNLAGIWLEVVVLFSIAAATSLIAWRGFVARFGARA